MKLLTETEESLFKPGQVWSYKTRPGEEGSLLTVVKVNATSKLVVVVSVYVEGLKVKNPQRPNGFNGEITHMPFSEKILKESVTELIRITSQFPNYENGYKEWKNEYEYKDGGSFGVQVSEAISLIEDTINKGKVIG
jgi:hypothetical protein